MAGRAPPGGPSALLRLTTDVLEALDQGTGGRTRFCEAVATLYSCTAVGHAWLEGGPARGRCACGVVRARVPAP
jgi:hypothetical protein